MDENEMGLPPDLSPDYEGIPDTADDHDPVPSGMMADDAMPMPHDYPSGVTGRVTAAEEVEGETLDERLRQELPDVPQRAPEHAGRLVAPESGVDEMDTTKEEVASLAPEPGLALSAEEQAIRVEGESAVSRRSPDGRSSM
jgi:hypothetical protein